MGNLPTTYDFGKSLQVRNENDLPEHITYEQFKIVYDNLSNRDQIMWAIMWETGGRVTAVMSIKWNEIDFTKNEIRLLVQKKKNHTTIRIPLSNAMINLLRNYMLFVKPKNDDYLFSTDLYNREKSESGRLTRQGAWKKVRSWGKKYLNIELHPHMLRHGLAIYLLSQNVPVPIISARLGHSNVFVTQNEYLVITPEIQRQMTQHIQFQ